ncbi:hypothetical protein RAD15_13895 [Bradyrhizobium sp. 14AA]
MHKAVAELSDPTARVLQDLYDSEINFTIATFWDAGFFGSYWVTT